MSERKLPPVGVATILVQDNKVLIAERLSGHLQGVFATPGGHLEWMETFEACAVRELMEETGIKTTEDNCEVFGVDQRFSKEEDFCCALVFVHVKAWVGDPLPMEPKKHGPWKWTPIVELPDHLLNSLQGKLHKLLFDSMGKQED